ncbi:serine protease snake-like [Trichoplusia ni]|uniref:Serine protease snake-like n=1 Tax=Trichoplusia ni TaxID=7111 RepID=A0A7E5VKI4_TRINI|nr:serine protease snake-like [Trichoplusia ni]
MSRTAHYVTILFIALLNSSFSHGRRIRYLNLREGSTCSWKGLDGVCANIYNCRSTMKDFRYGDPPPICSFQGVKTIVCCTDCELKDISTGVFQINPGVPAWLYKTGEKARDHCLDYLNQLEKCIPHTIYQYETEKHPTKNCNDILISIVGAAGGKDANRDQFRHMALLGYGKDINSAQWMCGGSLISDKFILTAGHCTAAPRVGPVRYAALGILKRSDPLELWQRYLVKRIVRHPQYKPPSKYHDIALLETNKRVFFNSHVLPACLHIMPQNYSESFARATGWGALGRRRELADTLQAVLLDRYDSHECSQLYPKHRHMRHGYNHTTQMCYGSRQEIRDTCEGDSGGPLQNAAYISECVYTILGVTSSGIPCGVAGNSGVYTRVLPYVPWIESVVWPDWPDWRTD